MAPPFADRFVRKYRIALAVVAVLVLGNGALLQPYMLRLTTDAPLINIAGRQRMLSQRLAKAALAFDFGTDEKRKAYLAELGEVLGSWSTAHHQLLRGDTRRSWAGPVSADVRAGLLGLEPSFVKMQDAARQIIQVAKTDRPDAATVREARAVILDNEADYLRRMDSVVGLYESEARGRAEGLSRIGWAVTGLTLASLGAIGLFILRPAVGLIRRQVSELGRARDELESRVQERTRELEQANERHRALLEQVSQVGRTSAIGEMASSLAHELKQPLGAIANYAEGCQVELARDQPAITEVRTAIEKLLAATLRAGQIIERIRKFVTRHELRREPFEPNRVVADVLEILQDDAGQRAVSVRTNLAPDLPKVWGDPVQVQQVLVNLLSNALDSLAAAKPLNPTVFIETKGIGDVGVEFRVTDNGEGIDQERIGKVFDAYFSTRASGMGMGLAISRSIVEAHEGQITVESQPGVKTTFRFTLPVQSHGDDDSHCLHSR
jgi:two-component system, LuxR family, sensor kinase FixL